MINNTVFDELFDNITPYYLKSDIIAKLLTSCHLILN